MKITSSMTGAEQVRTELLRIGGVADSALARTAESVFDFVSAEASKHNKTGTLVRSTYIRREGDGWLIGHDPRVARHSLFVHWGAPAHLIKPKSGGALRWGAGGVFHFAKLVNHPGNKPDPWMERAAALAPRLFAMHIEKVMRSSNGKSI